MDIVSLVVAAIEIVIGLLMLMRNYKRRENIYLFVFIISLSFWGISNSFLSYTGDINWSKATFLFTSLAFASFMIFLLYFSSKVIEKWRVYILLLVVANLFFSAISFTDNIVVSTTKKYGNLYGGVDINLGRMYPVVLLGYLATLIAAIAIMILTYKKSDNLTKNQIIYFFISIVIFALFALSTNLVLPAFGFFQFNGLGPTFSLIMVAGMAYAITKHRLMDIGMAVVRSLSFSVMILTLIALLAGSTWLVSLFTKDGLFTPWQASIIAFVIALIFWPLRIWVTKATDKFFYKRTYDPEVLIDSVAHQISSTLVLKDILGGANKILSEQMKLSRCAFVLFDDNKEILKQEAYSWPSFGVDNLYNLASNGLLVADELDDSESKKTIFLENNISLLLPIRNGNKLTGVFLSGEKNSGNLFNQQDFRTLSIITQSMALAIENAKSYSQIKDFNEILRQRIDEATKELRVKNAMLRKLDKAKDDFISMASHQLRTPLTSIKGCISMLADGDAGKISSQQKKILADAYISSDKMVRLVNDFLDVSRLQTGKFVVDRTTVNLMELVKTEVDGLLMVAQKKEIKLSCACHDEVPPLELDENKIRQVVMNFIDNAIFYSHPKSEIKIGLACDSEWVSFTVQDSGIGVPKVEQKELFTKFYRASNAKKQRPSGSGVGLYLAKKVIYAHDGKIIFETIEGKGSTFGFMLPVK